MTSHRTLLAWQKAREVTQAVIRLSTTSWKPQLAAVFSQLQRSSLSVQVNIAEGYAFFDSARLRNHLRIAYASALESDDLLDLLSEHEHYDRAAVIRALSLCRESQKLLFGLMRKYGAVKDFPDVERGRSLKA